MDAFIPDVGLNPYSNGITSLGSDSLFVAFKTGEVLILILMELPHWEENAHFTINQLISSNIRTNCIDFFIKKPLIFAAAKLVHFHKMSKSNFVI